MKKIIFILIIVLIIVGIVLGKNYIDSKNNNSQTQEETKYSDADSIRYEIEMINKITSSTYNEDEINQVLNRITTSGDYAKVEGAIKKYMKDYINMSSGITKTMDLINLNSILSEENLTKDAPDFIETKANLADAKLKFQEYKENVKNFLTEEKINSYIDRNTISGEAKDFFENEIAKMTEDEKEILNQLETTIDNANSIVEKEEAIINYLIENKNTWTIKDGGVNFDKEQKAIDYNNLLKELVAMFE